MAIRIPIISDYYDGGVKKAQQSFKDLAKNAALGAVSFGALSAFIGKATQAAIADEKAQDLLAQQLRISTRASQAQIDEVERAITEMSYQAAVADDELRPALGNLVRATDDAAKAQEILALALDISFATGKPLEAVSVALSKAYLGQVTALQRLGVPLDQAAVKAKDFDAIMGDLNDTFRGSADVFAKSTEGRMKTLRIAVDELSEEIGKRLLPALSRIADFGIPAVKNLASAFDGLSKAVEGAQNDQGFWEKTFKRSFQMAFDVTGGFLARMVFLRNETEKSANSFSLFANAANIIKNAGQNIKDFYLPELEKTSTATDKTNQKTKDLRKTIRDAFTDARDRAADFLGNMVRVRDEFAKTIGDAVRGAIDFGAIQSTAKEAGTTFITTLAETVGKARTFAERLRQLISAGLSQSAISQVAQAGAEAGTAIADELLAGGASAIAQANDLVAAAEQAAKETGTLAGATYYNEGVVLAQQLTKGITDVISKYKIKLSSPGLTEKQLRRLQNRFAVDVDFVMSQVPALANGGVVTGPTLALIGEAGPEAVVPLDRAGAMGNVTINVNGGDPNAVVDALRTYMRQNGSVPIRVSNLY
jgi:hypothetical protein